LPLIYISKNLIRKTVQKNLSVWIISKFLPLPFETESHQLESCIFDEDYIESVNEGVGRRPKLKQAYPVISDVWKLVFHWMWNLVLF
jgi:hypothetical protein